MRSVSVLLAVVLWAQGTPALPKNYQVQFENAWVRVTSVRYEPLEKVTAHAHTPFPSAYVYLNDGPPVTFSHVGGKPATRPATKAGAFRLYRGLEEIHEAQNTGNTPSEFLRVELKTTAVEPGSFWGKFERPAAASEPVVHFNHPQLRVSRVWIQPNGEMPISAVAEPALIVTVSPGLGAKIGETRWLDAGASARLRNTSTAAGDVLRFDFRTRPKETR